MRNLSKDILVRAGEPIKVDSDLSESDVTDVTHQLHDKIYELVLMNLADQDNEANNKALANAIKWLQSQNDQKSKDLLAMIYEQLGKTDSERNESFRRHM